MIIYEVTDWDELRIYYPSKKDAIKRAKKEATESGEATEVIKIDLGKIDKAKVMALLEGGGYCVEQTTVWTSEKPNNRKEQQ